MTIMIFLIDLMFVVWAIVAFSALLLVLAFGLIYAQKKLVAQGDVKIVINGDEENPLKVKPGSSLLSTLAGEKIFRLLPAGAGAPAPCVNAMWTRVAGISCPRN